mmetsp:Transcript_1503/g.4500  ORF Transcript_1503/g.4500 Transcript_1503/m.4500 type:complete len:333 (+) Transcript_1503:70-1068(+)
MARTAKADVDAISELLRQSGTVHAGAKQMLLDGLPRAVPAEGQQRHAMQEQFVKLAQSALLDLKRMADERLDAFQSAVTNISADIEVAKEAEAAAEQKVEAASAVVEERSQQVDVRCAALRRTHEERTSAEFVMGTVLEKCTELEAHKSEILSLLEGPFDMLLQGGWEDEEVRDSVIGSVTKLLGGMQAETSLVAATTKALALRPGSRAEFDKLTTATVGEVLRERVKSTDQQLQAKAHEREDVTAQALGLMALSEREDEEVMQARSKLAEAKEALKLAVQAREEAGAETGRRKAELSTQLSAQVLEEETAKQIHAALEAAGRLVELKYAAA